MLTMLLFSSIYSLFFGFSLINYCINNINNTNKTDILLVFFLGAVCIFNGSLMLAILTNEILEKIQ